MVERRNLLPLLPLVTGSLIIAYSVGRPFLGRVLIWEEPLKTLTPLLGFLASSTVPLFMGAAAVALLAAKLYFARRRLLEECFVLETLRGTSILSIHRAYNALAETLYAASLQGASIEYTVEDGRAKLVVRGEPEAIGFIERKLAELSYAINSSKCSYSRGSICVAHPSEALGYVEGSILVDWKGYAPETFHSKAVEVVDLSKIVSINTKKALLKKLVEKAEEKGVEKIVVYEAPELLASPIEDLWKALKKEGKEGTRIILVSETINDTTPHCSEKLKRQ